jgi:integrase
MAGTVVRLKGLKIYKVKGIQYVYHRASGIRLTPPHEPGSPDFLRAYADAGTPKKVRSKNTKTLDHAIDRYLDSAEFLRLRARTRTDYQRIIKWLRVIGDTPLSMFKRAFVYKLRDKAYAAHKRRFANYVQSVLSVILEGAVKAEWIAENPCLQMKKVRRPSDAKQPNVAWTEAEYAVMLERAPAALKGPLAMGWHFGMRGGDVIGLGKTGIRDGTLYKQTQKTGSYLELPIPDALQAILDQMPKHDAMTYFANSHGLPWDKEGFGTAMQRLRNKLADEGKVRREISFHGLRTTWAQRADALGIDTRKIADAAGHEDIKTTEGYIRRANVKKNSAEVIRLMNEG